MTVSIAMATYNGARFVAEQLQSFVAQTMPPDELVICDDQSTDDTLAILKEFAASAPFSVILHSNSSRLGVTGNFERALSMCSGDVIFLSDQDDVWFETKIETVLAVFDDAFPGCQMVLNDQIPTDRELRSAGRTKMQNLREAGFSADRMITGCCTAMTRAWRDVALPIPQEVVAHDTWIGGLARAAGVRKVIEVPLQYFRRHGENVSDWIMSRPEGAGRTGLLLALSGGLGDARAAWMQKARLKQLMAERLEERRASPGMALVAMDDVACALLAEADVHLRRVRVCSVPRYRRLPQIVAFASSGHYRHFAGLFSTLKDLLRK